MSLKNSKEGDVSVLPPDLDIIVTLLEGAEIDCEEDFRETDTLTLTLENGIVMTFDSTKKLISVEVG